MQKKLLGFSMLELMIVVAVIAILAAVTLVPEAQVLAYAPMDPGVVGSHLLLAVGAAGIVTNARIRDMQAKKAGYVREMRAITDKAAAENRDLTEDEQKKFDGLKAQLRASNDAIVREAELIAEEAQLGVATLPDGAVVVEENAERDGTRGFASFGHFAQAVRGRPNFQGVGYALGGELHTGNGPRAAAPTTFGNEGQGPDGGFAVPPDFAGEIFTHSLGEDSLLPLTDSTNV